MLPSWLTRLTVLMLLLGLAFAPSACAGDSPDDTDDETSDVDPDSDQDADSDDHDDPYADVPWLHEPVMVDQPFLWRVTTGDEDDVAPSYLFGTIHGGVRIEEVMHEPVQQALEASRNVYVELTLEEYAEAGPIMQEMGALPEDKALSDYFDEETYEQLTTFIHGIPGEHLERLEPFAVGLIVMPAMMPPVEIEAMDLHFAQHGSSVHGLETAREQFGGFSSMSRQFWADAVAELVVEWPMPRSYMAEMIEAYRSGDEEAMAAFTVAMPVDDDELLDEYLETLLFERNRNWMPDLTAAINVGNAFVAVGVGHLIGEQSVVDLLEQEGFTVERVTVD